MTLETPSTTSLTNSLDRVWEALDRGGFKPTRRANTFKALCPVHGDANPSLSVRYDSQAGKIALHCFGCEATVFDITAQLGLTVSDLFDAPLPDDRRTQNRAPRPRRQTLPPRLTREELATPAPDLTGAKWNRVKAYEYVDDAGVVQQRVHREETVVDGARHKRFTQSYRGANGRFVKRKPEGFAPLLYNLPAVTEAIAAAGDVWLLEGEKDADNATALGLVATTNAGGATAFPPELLERFRGGRVHLVVDNDQAGYKRAATVTAQLLREGIEARAYLPDVDDAKADFTDHIDAGGTVDTLIEITVDDAIALEAAAEAARLITQVEICRKEATAQLDAKGQDRATSERNAEAWARESAKRLDRITSLQPTIPTTLGARAAAAAEDLSSTVRAAAEISRDTFTTAGLTVPDVVAGFLAPTTEANTAEAEQATEQPQRTTTVAFQTTPAPAPTSAGRNGGGNGGGPRFSSGDDNGKRAVIKRDEYDVVDGITVSVKWERVKGEVETTDEDGNPTVEEGYVWEPRYTAILNGWAEIETVAVEDDGTDTEIARAPHLIAIRFYRHQRDSRGKTIYDSETNQPRLDSALVKFDEEQLRTGTWSQALPWPNLLESTTRRGKDQAWDAIRKARQTVASNSLVYTTLGWRTAPEGHPFFIHSTGAIDSTGAMADVEVKPSLFNVFNLPDPTTDADELRAAWVKGTLEAKDSWLLGRALAPLLAQSWGSVLKPNDATVHLVGGRASLKSAHGRLAVQYFAPDVHYHGVKEMLSGSAKGGSALGLIRSANTVSHLPLLIDDFAPDGNAKQAQNRLGELARMRFNSTGRKVSTQRGGVREDRPIEANLITTGELTATGSADTRILNIPLNPQSVDKGKALFSRLESRSYRAARALLGSTLIQWVAQHRDQMLEEIQAAIEGDTTSPLTTDAYWERRLSDLPHDSGVRNRLENMAVDLDRGIYIMLKMLREYGAITKDEATEFYGWARDGIYDAVALQDSAASDAGEILLEYLRESLISGSAHLSTQHGDAPMDAPSLGWVDQSAGEIPQWRPLGSRLGIIVGEDDNQRVYLIPKVAMGLAHNLANRADEVFSDTPTAVASSFESHGWITRDHEGKRSGKRRIGGQSIRVWDIPLSVLLGADDELGGDGPETEPTTGPDDQPGLFDVDPTPAAPATGPEIVDEEPPVDEYPPTDPYLDTVDSEPAADLPQPEQAEEPAPAATPVQATTAPRRRGSDPFRASVAVLHTDGIWLPDGTRLDLTEEISHAGQIAMLASSIGLGTQINTGPSKLRRTERGQVYMTRDFALSIGIPFDKLPNPGTFRYREKLRDATADASFVALARQAGFQVSGKDALDPSIEVWHDENPDLGVLIGFLPALDSSFQLIILKDDPAPALIADRLQRFTSALRFPYRKTPSSTGLDLLFALHPRSERDRLFESCPSPRVLHEAGHDETDIEWQRALTPEEKEHRWVHAYDRGGSYLAAVAGLEVGIGTPTHHPDPLPFTKLPGYWNITIPEDGHWLTPNLFSRSGLSGEATAGSRIWVATPTMELAAELGIEPEIHEAYLWHEKGRIFDTWQKRMRDARQTLDTTDPDDQIARDLLKKVYVSGLGIMASDTYRNGRHGFAPHRYDHVIAKARANILRRVFQIGESTGRWPVAISKDTILYTSPDVDAEASWPGKPDHYGRGLGHFKYEGSAELADHAQYFTGDARPYEGKSNLTEIF